MPSTNQKCLVVLQVIARVLVAPLCLGSLIYTCLYAYIYARENYYTVDDWQRCLVMPNKGDLHSDTNHFCTSAANFAGQAYLCLLIGLFGTYTGLHDEDLLPLGAYTSLVSVLGISIYRESYPYFCDPNFMTSTLLTLTKYIFAGMYDDLTAVIYKDVPSHDTCATAYKVNLLFLCVEWAKFSVAVMLLALCLYALSQRNPSKRRGVNRRQQQPPLQGAKGGALACCTTIMGLVMMFVSKEVVAETALEVGRKDGAGTEYPFLDNNLDVVSFTALVVVGCMIYSLCKRSQSSLKATAAIGFINLSRSFPGLFGTLTAYCGLWYPYADISIGRFIIQKRDHYRIWDVQACSGYVMNSNKLIFLDTEDTQADAITICRAFQSSIAGQLTAWASVMLIVISAIYMLTHNEWVSSSPRMGGYPQAQAPAGYTGLDEALLPPTDEVQGGYTTLSDLGDGRLPPDGNQEERGEDEQNGNQKRKGRRRRAIEDVA